ncbi:MAG: peptidylprolyl isomerase, partial [Tannerellaceae bacterium]|nr:peptidylprolyl isomerase [Tannerellaceae bacterium]
ADSVVMTIGGKPVMINEFLFMAQKNEGVDFSNKKSLQNYIELFKNFKLKVIDAEEMGIHQTPSFAKEYEKYRADLISDYMADRKGEEAAVRDVYNRMSELLEVSHIFFPLRGNIVSKDTVEVYQLAMQVYQRINNGEDFEIVGRELADTENIAVFFEHVTNFQPMRTPKVFENAVYSMAPGTISLPVRSSRGFHIIKLHDRRPNPGTVQVAHILVSSSGLDLTTEEKEKELYQKAQDIYNRVMAGENFEELAIAYSGDKGSAAKGGILAPFGVGEMVKPFEEAAFALTEPGEIAPPVKSQFGYHIIKLINKKDIPSFEEQWESLSRQIRQGERNFEYYKAFDERMKEVYDFKFYPDAYAELQALCDEYFPTDETFYEKAKEMEKPLFVLRDTVFPQSEFATYIQVCPFSTKTYSGDFMQEIFDLFVREIYTIFLKEDLYTMYPEINYLLQEYRDGMLLFEISNRKVWNHPFEEQEAIEQQWLKELNTKYPVILNQKVIKRLMKQS